MEGESVTGDATPWDPEELDYWAPVDTYTGGAEHAVMHLLYTRFFTKALRDAGLVDFDEPMLQLRNQGIILGEPRPGDFVEVTGRVEGRRLRRRDITVYLLGAGSVARAGPRGRPGRRRGDGPR